MTPGQAFRVGEVAAEAVHKSGLPGDIVQQALGSEELGDGLVEVVRLGPEKALRLLRGEQGERIAPGPPSNLELWFEIQAEQLRGIGAGKEVGMDEGKFKDALMTAARDFQYRPDFAALGLSECFLVPYGLSLEFWVEAGGIANNLNLSRCRNYQGVVVRCRNYQGVVVPEKGVVLAIQAQFGEKYRNKEPGWVREHLHPLEQGMTLEERLAGQVVFGSLRLEFIFSDIIGSLTESGDVPGLYWHDGRPRLNPRWRGRRPGRYTDWDDFDFPDWGAASRGK